MPFSEKYNALFIHIPKSGGSSVERYLEIVKDEGFGVDLSFNSYENFHETLIDSVRLYKHKINNKTELIATIRDPYSRIVSHYSGRSGNWLKNEGKTLNIYNFLLFLFFGLPVARIACFIACHYSRRIALKIYPQYDHLYSQSFYLKEIDNYANLFARIIVCKASDLPLLLGDRYPSQMPFLRKSLANTSKLNRNKLARLIIRLHYLNDFSLFKKLSTTS